jgi:hypothetical protein
MYCLIPDPALLCKLGGNKSGKESVQKASILDRKLCG